ncbi:MAG: hypothetical protein JWP01_3982, partial [Myxococcales bacterium]|nr:hypothetical protein [Myxococcales bacterium]
STPPRPASSPLGSARFARMALASGQSRRPSTTQPGGVHTALTLVRHIREHFGRPGDTSVAYFVRPETGEQCRDDDIWAHLIPEMVPDDGNGYHTSLVVAVSWPVDDGKHYATGVCSKLEVIPLRDGRWTIAFEERASHSPMPIDSGDPTTFTAFADDVYATVREYFDTYALPPEAPSRPPLGFLRRI